MVSANLPPNIDITAPYFKGIRPYKSYGIVEEIIRQSAIIGEQELIRWMNRWPQASRLDLY